ncbi:MAG: VCBS repeat-containing protein [bacterium]|nr:VCBS repeat-containing protein [bacterium]
MARLHFQVCILMVFILPVSFGDSPWPRHTIDAGSQGADGVRLADFDGDGRLDILTGWEEGGVIRLYLHPPPEAVQDPWPRMEIGQVRSPEDAVLADLDGDGDLDAVSCTEGKEQTIWFHWVDNRQRPPSWKTEALPPSIQKMQWMFCLPMELDHQNGIDLVVGGKNQGARIGWFQSPSQPQDTSQWTWHPLGEAGWIMSILGEDADGDGDIDLFVTDRKGPQRGVYWLENPGAAACAGQWRRHEISKERREFMFLAQGDVDGDGLSDLVIAAKPRELIFYRRVQAVPPQWQAYPIAMPAIAGTAKGVAVGDIDRDGQADLVFTCEDAKEKVGVMWMAYTSPEFDTWISHNVSGLEGTKYDIIALLDLDGDSDLDIITCEERDNLGVIWYENPAR